MFLKTLHEGRERILTQYAKHGNTYSVTRETQPTLEAGVYNIGVDMQGNAFFDKATVTSDALLRLNNKKMNMLFEEWNRFWTPEGRAKYEGLGMTHKHAYMFYGVPGTGKSCYLKLFMEEMEKMGDVAFICNSPNSLPAVLKQFKEVEPERRVAVIMEDIDNMIYYGEHALLELMDGPNAVGGVFYIGTTNYLERIPPRMLRASRFGTKIEIGPPAYEDRLNYLTNKLGKNESESLIDEIAKRTQGAVFADLKDIVVSVVCLGKSVDDAISAWHNRGFVTEGKPGLSESLFDSKLESAWKKRSLRAQINLNESSTLAAGILRDMGWDVSGLKADTPDQKSGAPSPEAVKSGLEKRLAGLGIEGISVDSVECAGGDCIVDFVSADGDVLTVVFGYDDEEGEAYAVVYDGEEGDDGESVVIDLDPLAPGVIKAKDGVYLDLVAPMWLNKTSLLALLDAGEFADMEDRSELATVAQHYDEFGHILPNPVESLEEAFKVVIRGGQRVKLPVIRRRRKKRLSSKQRAGLRRAALTRKSPASKMKRRKSLMLRKRMKLKKGGLPKGMKVGG